MKKRVFKFFKTHWAVIAIIAVWFIFSSPYFLKGLVPFPSKYLVTFFPPWSAAYGMPVKNNAMPDVITQIYPWKRFTIETWGNGYIPLWNPYSFSGTPHAANYQTAVFSPFNLLFFILPFADAWSINVLLQPLLAGIFMYAFLRSLEKEKYASLVGSIAFMFCGFLVVWMAYATLGFAILWLPLILGAIHRQIKHPSWWNLFLLTMGMALSFFSGHFQISLYVAGLSFVYLIFEMLHTRKLTVGISLFTFFFFGILLALPQLFPSYDAYVQSVRSASFGKGEVIPWLYLITIIAPDFFGNPVTRNDWFGHYAEWSSYIGILPLLFAFYSLIGKRNKQVLFFAITAIVCLFLATPTLFNDWLFKMKLPAISTSAASRIIVLVSFSLSVLSSFGIENLVVDWKSNKGAKIFGFCIVVALLLLGFWIFFLVQKPLPLEKSIVAKRNLVLPSLFVLVGLSLFLIGIIKKPTIRHIVIGIFFLVLSFDLLRFATKWMPFDPKEFIFPQMKVISFLQKEAGNNRVFGNFGNELGSNFSIQTIEGYDALYQERYGEFIRAVSDGIIHEPSRSIVLASKTGKYSEEMFSLLGVKYILHRISDGQNVWAYPIWKFPNYRSIYRDEHYEVFENISVLPRAFLASSYVVVSDKQKIIDTLFAKDFDKRETVVLEEKPALLPQEGNGSVSVIQYRPTVITFTVDSAAPKLLFLSDSYDPGWKAFIDGIQTPLYRADYDFRAIAVPSGIHTVHMIYQPKSIIWGLSIAFIILLILVLGSIKELFYAHRHI